MPPYFFFNTKFFKMRKCDQCFNSGPRNIPPLLFMSFTIAAVGAGTPLTRKSKVMMDPGTDAKGRN